MTESEYIKQFFDDLLPIFETANKILNENVPNEGCLKFVDFYNPLSQQLKWSDKKQRSLEPIIREYVRHHPLWIISAGAKGGIAHRSIKIKKDAIREAKNQVKSELEAILKAKLENQTNNT